MQGENYPYTNIAGTIADAIWNSTSFALGHGSLLGLTGLIGARTTQASLPKEEENEKKEENKKEDQKNDLNKAQEGPSLFSWKRGPRFLRNWLGSFVFSEAAMPTTYTSAMKERLRPIVTKFLTPIIERYLTPVINNFAEQGLIKITPAPSNWGFTSYLNPMNYFNATSTSSVSDITCTFDCKTAETCLNQILDCGDQMLNVLENGAPQGGETLAYLLDTMLSAANTGIGMPSNVIQAVATELGLPYYTVFLGATALVGAAGYGFYNTLGGGTTQNNNQTQSQVAHGGSVVNNIVFSDAMLKTIKNQNDGQTNTKKKLSASD